MIAVIFQTQDGGRCLTETVATREHKAIPEALQRSTFGRGVGRGERKGTVLCFITS